METHAFHAQLLEKKAASACAQATAAATSRGHTRPGMRMGCRDPVGKRRSSRVFMQRIRELFTPKDKSRQLVMWPAATLNAPLWEASVSSGVLGQDHPAPPSRGAL
eukprot:CAMPEP_0176273444 /NCGR_PEP_ID=MMETSP0121_2-20121125/46223_1 /TAXON_ID=160619 /ORGANISM="Kryptoperidinium foliaceum, Strain CCMP 1326" /LENGTH=105 /DNA_ID=CAMNT_0017613629 /DNA_START=181 /DNA_END=499 /DNA_ORIENTATION=-